MQRRGRVRVARWMIGVAMAAAGGTTLDACAGTSGPASTVQAYLSDWASGHYGAMARLVQSPPSSFASYNQEVADAMALTSARYSAGSVTTSGSTGFVPITEHLVLAPAGPVTVRNRLDLVQTSAGWRVAWSPASILPGLQPGDTVQLNVNWPQRAAVLGAGGAPLVTEQAMVHIGIVGSRITDPGALTTALEAAGAPAAQVQAALTSATAHPAWFTEVVDLPEATYAQDKAQLYPVPGTAFEQYTAPTAVTPGLAAHVVGSLGPITAEQLQSLGRPYQAGDMVGQTGIEAADERTLAGTPSGSLEILDPNGNVMATLTSFTGHPGSPVSTTIDPKVQGAAEAALAAVTEPAALVAIQASTGAVLASVSLPSSDAFDNALAGAFPPGSTFKIVTSADLIEHGASPLSSATCPPSITVGGQSYHNFEGEASALTTLTQAFAMSCNTAFIGLAGTLPDASFPTTAAQFGFGTSFQPGLAAFGGKVPAPGDDADRAATAIGQAQVLVSPLAMATAVAAVDSGSLHLPRLVQGAADDTAPAQPLDSTVDVDLKSLMASVVAPGGTASGAGLPAGTSGKTGTAEFGNANPPATHAWFVGFRGDVAFAVLVVGGGVGGSVAAPIAARFLDALPST